MSLAASRPRPRLHTRRVLWAVLVLALIAALAGTAYRSLWVDAAPAFRTAPVAIGSIEKTVTALGALQPKDYVDVGAQVSGQLEELHVEIGDRVKEGDLLAEIDPTVFETRVRMSRANLENLRAQLAQQQAELALARNQLQRNRNLFKSKIISEDVLQTSETQAKVGEVKIAALEAQIDAAQATYDGDVANLGYTKIYAPMAGTIVSESAVEGQTLNANQSTPTIVRIADLDTMTLWAQVAEADVVAIKPGMPVYFTTLGLPDRRWRATVRQTLPTPEIVNDVVLYNVLIDVDNADQVLMTDMTAQVFFVLGEAQDVPVVPLAALGPARAGADGEHLVSVLTENGPSQRTVRIGLTNRTTAEVLEGLSVGERVIVGTASESGDGAAGSGGRPGIGPRLRL